MFLLPNYYKNSRVMRELLQSAKLAIEEYLEAEGQTARCFFIMKTPNIAENERDVGIVPDDNIPEELRRQRVLAKLRSTPYATKAKIVEIAQAFYDGDVDVTERNPEYVVDIGFVGFNGEPIKMSLMEQAIKEIIPAHLAINWLISYVTHESLKRYTHGELRQYTHAQIRRLN